MLNELQMALSLGLLAWLGIQYYAPAIVTGECLPGRNRKPEPKPWERLLQFKGGLGSIMGGSVVGSMLDSGGDDAPGADPGIKKSAYKLGELGDDWLKFAKEQFASGEDRVAAFDELIGQIQQGQLGTMDKANQWAQADRDRYEKTFLPLQDKLIQDANDWDSPERQAKMAAEAKAGVTNQAQLAQDANQRQMASLGVNPNAGRFQASNNAQNTNTALAAAGAENSARDNVRQQGMALRSGAAQLGNALPGQAVGNSSLGLTAGGAALGAQSAGNAAFQNNLNIMGQGYQGAMAGHQGKASVLGNLHNSNLNAWSSQMQADAAQQQGMMSGLGSMAGMAMMMSSKKVKEDKQPATGSLEKVKQMPVEQWKYKDGVADGGKHVGPYAEDFTRATGLGDGKQIAMQDAIGLTMGAVQELAGKVDKLNKGKRA